MRSFVAFLFLTCLRAGNVNSFPQKLDDRALDQNRQDSTLLVDPHVPLDLDFQADAIQPSSIQAAGTTNDGKIHMDDSNEAVVDPLFAADPSYLAHYWLDEWECQEKKTPYCCWTTFKPPRLPEGEEPPQLPELDERNLERRSSDIERCDYCECHVS